MRTAEPATETHSPSARPAEATPAAALAAVEPFVDGLRRRPEVEGVVVLSSAARPDVRSRFDELSDLDVGVFVDVPYGPEDWSPNAAEALARLRPRLPTWLPEFSFHVPVRWGRLEVNVNQLCLPYEGDPRTDWPEPKREAYAYTASVVFDRRGAVRDVIRRRSAYHPAAEREARILRLASRLVWDVRRAPLTQASRGHVDAAHALVSTALEELVELCYVLARRFLPHPKWRLPTLRREGLLGEAEYASLLSVLRCDPSSEADLRRRIDELERLWNRVRVRAGSLIPPDPYRAYHAHPSSDRQLLVSTVASEVRSRDGASEAAVDLANYLLLGSVDDARRAVDAAHLPPGWEDAARVLRDVGAA